MVQALKRVLAEEVSRLEQMLLEAMREETVEKGRDGEIVAVSNVW